jgi:hypothetical protein
LSDWNSVAWKAELSELDSELPTDERKDDPMVGKKGILLVEHWVEWLEPRKVVELVFEWVLHWERNSVVRKGILLVVRLVWKEVIEWSGHWWVDQKDGDWVLWWAFLSVEWLVHEKEPKLDD